MAEIIGLVASVASLIAFTSETSKACNKLAKSITCFQNAPADIQKIGAELLDLAQVLDLFQSVFQPLRGGKAGEQEHVDFIERSLARTRNDVQKVADLLVSMQPKTRGRNRKGRAKWVYKKNDIALMMAVIDRQKQTLLTQLNMLNLKITHTGVTELEDSRKDMRQVGSRVESLTAFLTTSTSESTSRIEGRIKSSANSLESSIRDEIHRTISSIPRESNFSRESLETLSILVSERVASRFESLTSENPSNHPRRLTSTEKESRLKTADGSRTDSVDYAVGGSQATVNECFNEGPDYLYREGTSSRMTSRTTVQRMTSVFGTVLIRRSAVRLTFSGFDPEFGSERAKVEIDFFPATWLRSWTGCGMFLARMGFGQPKFDFSLAVARILDDRSYPHKRSFDAVRNGDVDTLKELFQLKVAYPTDRNNDGQSLLYIAARRGQLAICKLLLQQGAAVDINTPEFVTKTYPVQIAVAVSVRTNTRDFLRLFLKHDADITILDEEFVYSVGTGVIYFPWNASAETKETGSLFRFIVENDPSFDIHQRDHWGRTVLMQVRGQPRQTYEELIRLGADAKAIDLKAFTVLHHFFENYLEVIDYPCRDVFLDGGEILALLIQAGADPQARNRFGAMPQDYLLSHLVIYPLQKLRKWINLAFWHQALRICGLSGSRYCDCPAHHQKKIPGHDFRCSCQRCMGRFDRSLRFDTFEEEMSAALMRLDLNAQEYYYCKGWDAWVQGVLRELQTRQKKVHTEFQADRSQVVGCRSECAKNDRPGRDETQVSKQIGNEVTQEFDSDEDWQTSSGTSSEDDWESAPET